ncbi:hypothetical protein EYF80_040238 [Liparis tanakae]|uniref:Uncharacterized protein n=1 Tax=Liparis tanakae TaxID=230148 RepID=A0A4Z2G9D1_9TELE|nr:hypothetical protein EYF80_040238 [Liparis tanakae]
MAWTWSLSLGERTWLVASSTVLLTELARLSFRRGELAVDISSRPVVITSHAKPRVSWNWFIWMLIAGC